MGIFRRIQRIHRIHRKRNMRCRTDPGFPVLGAVLWHLGVVLGRLEAVLKPSWGRLGASWGGLGGVLEQSWDRLGASGGGLGAILGCLGASWGILERSWGGWSFHYKLGVHFPGKMARCIVFPQSSAPGGNSAAFPADPPFPQPAVQNRPWFPRAGGQDDGSYTNSLRLAPPRTKSRSLSEGL